MMEIPAEVLRAVELAQTYAFALASVRSLSRTLQAVYVVGIPRHTHLACVLRVAGFEPRETTSPWAPQVWTWLPPPNRAAN